jgi:hypothetical protein
MRVGEAVGLGVDDQVDRSLRPAVDRLRAMAAGLAETEPAQENAKVLGGGFVDGEFDEADALGGETRRRRFDAEAVVSAPIRPPRTASRTTLMMGL